jgi:hypothetical protein
MISAILGLASLIGISVLAQAPPPEQETARLDHSPEQDHVADTPINREALEEQLIGHWVLEGALGGKRSTHDFDVQ